MKRRVARLSGIVLTTALWSLLLTVAEAAWLTKVPQTLRQPDGTILHCYVTGDEYSRRVHDDLDYTIIQDPVSGYYVYARLANGELVPSSFVAGKADPRTTDLQKGANVPAECMRPAKGLRPNLTPRLNAVAAPKTPLKGVINNLVVFIRFQDQTEFPDSASSWTYRFNSSLPGANSLRNYFFEASYEQLTVNSTFYPSGDGLTILSYQDVHLRDYYRRYNQTTNPIGYTTDGGARGDTLLLAALEHIAPLVPSGLAVDRDNDGAVDNICFVIRGDVDPYGSILWAHASSMAGTGSNRKIFINGKKPGPINVIPETQAAVGMIGHEFFHTLGAPDLYHTRGDAPPFPVGPWDLMDEQPDPPPHMGAFLKMCYGTWIDSIPIITSSGTYALRPLTSSTNNAFMIASPNSTTEFFVVEYRKRTGTFESHLPGDGLLVYRINTEKYGNTGGPPDEVYLYRPGNDLNDVYKANFSSQVGRTAINDSTIPASVLSDGSPGGLQLVRIGSPDSLITFDVTIPSSPKVTLAGYVRGPGLTSGTHVTLKGLPGNPATDQTGYYSCTLTAGWSGTVTPQLPGYSFEPSSTSYTNLQVSTRTNYTGTLQFLAIYGYVRTAGGVPIQGVELRGLPGPPTTDSTGFYMVRVEYGWSGTMVPFKLGVEFHFQAGISGVQHPLEIDVEGTPLTYTIAGRVHDVDNHGISDVLMTGLPGSPLTDTSGNYSATVAYHWSGTVTPVKAGYGFRPPSSYYSAASTDWVGQDYLGTLPLIVSGHVRTADGKAINAVVLSGLPHNPATDSTGLYRDTVEFAWSGTVTPQKTGYMFSPPSTSYTHVMSAQGADYIGARTTDFIPTSLHIPDHYYLSPNFPNPFNPSTTVRFGLPSRAEVSMTIYNIGGQVISTPLREATLDAGHYTLSWPEAPGHGGVPASGVYFIKFLARPDGTAAQVFSQVEKIILVK